MSTKNATGQTIEKHEGCGYQYEGDGATFILGDWLDYDDKVKDFVFSIELENLRGVVPNVGLTVTQVKALIERFESMIEAYTTDPRPTPECPIWCTRHIATCVGSHYGQIVVNDVEIEVQMEPDFDAPRVDVSALNWVNGGDLTDLAEALHIAERLLSGPEQVSA